MLTFSCISVHLQLFNYLNHEITHEVYGKYGDGILKKIFDKLEYMKFNKICFILFIYFRKNRLFLCSVKLFKATVHTKI